MKKKRQIYYEVTFKELLEKLEIKEDPEKIWISPKHNNGHIIIEVIE